MTQPSLEHILDRLEAALRHRQEGVGTALRPPRETSSRSILDQPNRDHERRVEPDPDFLADQQWAEAQEASRPRVTRSRSLGTRQHDRGER